MFRSTCCALTLALGLVPGAFAQTPASMRMTVDSARREVVITLGPYHIASDAGMEDMSDMMMESMPRIVTPRFAWPVTAWVRGFQVTVEDSLGHPLPRRLLHHYGILDFDRRELAYPVIQHLLGGGAETPDVTLPKTVGIPLTAGDRMAVYFMWHNMTGSDLDGVYLRMRVFWIAGNQLPRPTLAQPFWLDANWQVGVGNEFEVPPGGCSRTYTFELPLSGRLLAVSGHVHEHGRSVRLEDAESGDVIVQVVANREPDGTVRNVSRKLFGIFGDGPHLKAHHRYRLVVTYDNPTADTLTGMMGLLGGLFVPDDMTAWPALDRGDPTYLVDLNVWEARMPALWARVARATPPAEVGGERPR